MPTRPTDDTNMPTKTKVLKAAPNFTSVSALAEHFGVKQGTFNSYLKRHGWREEVDSKLKPRVKAKPSAQLKPHELDDPQALEMDRLRSTNKTLENDNKELTRRLVSEEDFFNRVVEATRTEVATPNYKKHKVPPREHVNSMIAPNYDQQFGQFVRPTDTPGNQGAYSVEIFDQRLARWVDGVCGIMAKRYQGYEIDELILPLGGDHVEGDEIFPGQAWQLELDPARQVWMLAEKMETAYKEIFRFAKEEIGVKHIAMYGVDDNHGAVGGKKGGARPKTYSWNWLFLKILFDKLRAEPVDQFAIEPGGALFFRTKTHEFQMIHGHQVRGWGGLPFYGLTRFDGRSIRLHSRIYRYLLMGHHHQPAEIPNGAGETIMSGDWVGANNLSGMLQAASRPQQKVLFVSEKWGVDGTERIYFADAEEAYEPTMIYGRENS